MLAFKNKIAVITGAGSGIGKALAVKAAQEEMRVVITDIDQEALRKTEQEIKILGAKVLAKVSDVTRYDDLKQLAAACLTSFGIPQLVFNNAGVGGIVGPIWEIPITKLEWMLNINLMGVVHGLQVFIPLMQKLPEESHIINTASMASFYTAPYLSCYEISKHAVAALTEAAYHDLKIRQSKIKMHLLCPGWVKTNILHEKNSPFSNEEISTENFTERDAIWITHFAKSIKRGITPAQVAEITFKSLLQGKFYIFTHPEMKQIVEQRTQAILNEFEPVDFDITVTS